MRKRGPQDPPSEDEDGAPGRYRLKIRRLCGHGSEKPQ